MADYNKELLIALREKARLGPKTFQLLLTAFGSLEEIVAADVDQLASFPRISYKKAEAIVTVERHLQGIQDDLEMYRQSDIEALTIFDDNYPATLKETNDPPFVLYYKGNFPLDAVQFIAVVGASGASAEGIEVTVDYSMALAEKGAVIVSGLARGIDTAAHLGAIKADGRSYAVLGCGINNIYPPENKRLAEELLEKGAIISEYPPDSRVTTGRLISRNRIIVGLSHSVVIGEVDKGSGGTLDTAVCAKNLGKLLFAIGSKTDSIDPGLIEYGAIPLDDISKVDLITDHSF